MNINLLIDRVEEELGEQYPLATIRRLVRATIDATPTVSEKEMHKIRGLFQDLYPHWYGYTIDPNAVVPTYLLFRTQEESFDTAYAVVIIRYRREEQ